MTKYWSFGISLSNEYSGLISFRIDRFDLLAVQGILKNLIQHHNLKASSSLMLSHLYGPTECLYFLSDKRNRNTFIKKNGSGESLLNIFAHARIYTHSSVITDINILPL